MANPRDGLSGQDLKDFDQGARVIPRPRFPLAGFRSYEVLAINGSFIPRINGFVMGGIFDTYNQALGQCATFAGTLGMGSLDDSMDIGAAPAPSGFSSTDPCLTYGTYDTTPLLTAGNGLYDTFGITGYSAESYGFLVTFTSEALSNSFNETYATFTANGVVMDPSDWNEISNSQIYSTTVNGAEARRQHQLAGSATGTGTMEWTL